MAVLAAMSPAAAADTKPPEIVKAVMGDANGNDKADRVVLTFSEKVKHALDTDGKYPFTVAGYKVKRVTAASGKNVTLLLVEKPSADQNAKPSVKYTRTSADPVKDLAGNQAKGQTYADTFPLLAIFVSPLGSDANPGTQAAPMLTVPEAITEAGDIGAIDVYLAGGTYAGPIHPSGNMSIRGGFTASFTRSDAPAVKAVLTGAKDVDTGQFGTVFILDFGGTMSLVRLTIQGPNATDPGATSYGVVVRNSTVVIKKSTILAGDGADGADGDDGQIATTGISATGPMKGADGGPAAEFVAACDITSHGAGGGGGANAAAPAGGSPLGGTGGNGGEMDTSCFLGTCDNCNATAGDDGFDGGQAVDPNFGIGGPGGPGVTACLATGAGDDGLPGLVTNGAAGSGASEGSMSAFFWAPRNGTDGGLGENGGGGGGGGGSGGCDTGTDSYGAGGGGGGAGGARAASAGGHGSGGGASFGVFVYSATAFSAGVSITGTKFVGGTGGNGGPGGDGGKGQDGGLGGAGGLSVGESAAGGAGGAGGHGGHSGGGGGGAGGYSYLIYTWQSVVTQSGNTFTVRAAGLGGVGGVSPGDGNDGGAGSDGFAGDIGSCSLLLIC